MNNITVNVESDDELFPNRYVINDILHMSEN